MGPTGPAFEGASNTPLKAEKLDNTMSFMFETRFPQHLTLFAAKEAPLQDDYIDCWTSLEKKFDGKPGSQMRIATLKDHSPDGRLVIVEPDGKTCRPAKARTLQQALDAGGLEPEGDLVAFHEHLCHSPLPRAFQFLDGSAYVNHVELVRKARGADDAREFLDRSADVSGRVGQLSGAARPDSSGIPTGASTSRPRSR